MHLFILNSNMGCAVVYNFVVIILNLLYLQLVLAYMLTFILINLLIILIITIHLLSFHFEK